MPKLWPWRTGLTRALKHTCTHMHTGQNTIWDISAQVLTNTHISRCRLFLSVTVKNQTLHPSARVIPSNKCHVAMVQAYPHERVNQVPVTSCSLFFLYCSYFIGALICCDQVMLGSLCSQIWRVRFCST